MSALDLAATMDGLGAQATAWGALQASSWQVYSWPVPTITVPAVLVDYPSTIEVGITFQRGGDHLVLPVFALVGLSGTKDARDALSALMAGGADLVAALEGTYSWGDVEVVNADIAQVVVGAVAYLGLKLTCDITT